MPFGGHPILLHILCIKDVSPACVAVITMHAAPTEYRHHCSLDQWPGRLVSCCRCYQTSLLPLSSCNRGGVHILLCCEACRQKLGGVILWPQPIVSLSPVVCSARASMRCCSCFVNTVQRPCASCCAPS